MDDPFLLRRDEVAELFLIRHADALPEADEIIPSGVYDDLPLSRVGRKQAQALAARLKTLSFHAAYSSPLCRCQETAAPLLEQLRLPLTIVPDIKEVRLDFLYPLPADAQDLQALCRALQVRQMEIVRLAGGAGHWDAIAGSESSQKFRRRVVGAIDEIARRHRGERVLIFAHGGVINAYVAEALGLDKDFFFPAANTSISVIRVNGERRVLYVLNDLAHLPRRNES
ncbi:MAG TPA: histidine phosphatase family protein [Ktedonobacteraceae bacterium]|jgi:broad specificity phosphatase PhoE